ncbi:MAG TPA: DEAD/DEAH box helicase [Elusimicrobia bacterium]|nr:DEAD/DEAH box helicase [Elusimicrobiota bacterium]
MKLHFDANQQFQLDAIKSVVALFEGQPLSKGDYEFSISQDSGSLQFNENGVGNNLVLSEEQILQNLKEVQKQNDITVSAALEGLNFSVEMETGTGKTYVYLRTIYELNKKYGFKKFIIVVPSVAIREGVLKNLEITFEHFQNLYDKTPATYQVYDSSKVSNLRGFALSNAIQILVINIDSFAKDVNIINKENDKLTGKKPIEFIQSTKPIVIVDEPQNMETEIRKTAIANLNPLCTLRYSATHTNPYNLVYQLNPVRAYDMGLVKQIEVDSVYAENDFNRAFIQLENLKSTKTKTSVRLKIDVNTEKGVVRKSVSVKIGDDLFELSNKSDRYKDGFIINNIDVGEGYIELSNGDRLNKGETRGGLRDEVMKVQIRKAVEEHFNKEKNLKEKGIKVLTLFFIDRVANYRHYDESGNAAKGKFAGWFEDIYKEFSVKPIYKGIIPFKAEQVHNGYFAQDKKGILKDSSERRETQADDDTYQLIMKDKEKLLDINEPLRFIFSHSALREGWDNPNVFQICTLNETKSELKKRQEIGRGLRLSVNQTGDRVFDKNINKLTIVANESYEEFAGKLQKEIEDDCGVEFIGRIKDKNKRVKVELKKNFSLDPNFIELWNKIKYRTTYRVNYDTEELIKTASRAIRNMPEVRKPVIKSVKTGVDMVKEGITGHQLGVGIYNADSVISGIPDILNYIQNKTELTRSTILRILKESERLADVFKNSQLFLDMVVVEIKNVLNDFMVNGIKYEKIGGQEYAMMLFEENEIETYIENLYKVTKQEKTLANYIEISSMSGRELQFAKDCETNENVVFYFKLPRWFRVKTPIGDYNPDWALVFKNEKKLYFVAETKGSLDKADLRAGEGLKIKCGQAHFKEFKDVEYKTVTKVSELI